MSFANVALVALCVLGLFAVVVGGGLVGLHIAVRGTSEAARPAIIRALSGYFRSLIESLFRWRRQ